MDCRQSIFYKQNPSNGRKCTKCNVKSLNLLNWRDYSYYSGRIVQKRKTLMYLTPGSCCSLYQVCTPFLCAAGGREYPNRTQETNVNRKIQ